ncbi:hypothetical protein K492DRAFT_135824, partial [Lichtheimia hyalospora FSU 10163]
HSIQRTNPTKIKEEYDWLCKRENTGMNFLTNCVLLDEYDFDFNMKRLGARSTKGTPVIITRSTTRPNTTSILGAISATGLVVSLFPKMTINFKTQW